jgi:hypothetical protein
MASSAAPFQTAGKKVSGSAQSAGKAIRNSVNRDNEKDFTSVDTNVPTKPEVTSESGRRFISGYKREALGGPQVQAFEQGQDDPDQEINRPNVISQVTNQGTKRQNKFYGFTKADKDWVEMEARKRVMQTVGQGGDGSVIEGVGQVQIQPNSPVWDYFAREQQEQFHADFKKFIFSMIDLSKPEERNYWNKIAPAYLKEKRAAMRQETKERAVLEDIALNGVQTEKDLFLLYKRQQQLQKDRASPINSSGDTPVPRNSLLGEVFAWFVSLGGRDETMNYANRASAQTIIPPRQANWWNGSNFELNSSFDQNISIPPSGGFVYTPPNT